MADLYEFTVEWPSTSAQSVIVTGDFDHWSKSLPLSRSPNSNHFTATIKVPYGCPTRYKFIVDGEWQIKQEEPTEYSPEGFLNNVYYVPLKAPLEVPKPSTNVNESSVNSGNGKTGSGKRLSATAGQFVKDLKDTITAREGTSSALGYVVSGLGETVRSVVGVDPINANQIAIPTPTTPHPSTGLPSPTFVADPTAPTSSDAVPSPESDAQPTVDSVAPIVPITIVPVYARENCTIDPTKVVTDEESIGTFVGLRPTPKSDEAKEDAVVAPPPGLPVIVTSPPSPPEESYFAVVEESKEGKESVSEVVPLGKEIEPIIAPEPTGTSEPVLEEPERVGETEPVPVPAPASESTPTPVVESIPETPSKPTGDANGHTKLTSDASTAVESSSRPTTPVTTPGAVAESVTSTPTSTVRKSKVFPQLGNGSPSKGGSADELGVKGKGTTASRKKRTSSIFGSLKKLFHHEKDKEKKEELR